MLLHQLAPYIKSTHLKDTRMNPDGLTTILEECSPGEGTLDYTRILPIIDKYLEPDAPVLLEHMQTFESTAVLMTISQKKLPRPVS